MTFKDKVVAITGAAGGIGQSLCRLFLNEGAKIAAIDKKASQVPGLVHPGTRCLAERVLNKFLSS